MNFDGREARARPCLLDGHLVVAGIPKTELQLNKLGNGVGTGSSQMGSEFAPSYRAALGP